MKVLGFIEMKKRTGKVVFVCEDGKSGVVGQSCDKIFLYDDLSKKINESSIGKNIHVNYTCGYNGKAYVSDVEIK